MTRGEAIGWLCLLLAGPTLCFVTSLLFLFAGVPS
jgi:hypothetical protein